MLTMTGNIDGTVFRNFAFFDSFVRKKGWRNPVIFACIMTAFAAVCFAARKTHEQAAMLGGVLLAIGLLLPAVWFALFYVSVSKQVKINGLSATKAQYYVLLSPEKIRVIRGEERAEYEWKSVYMAYRVKGCIYLYVTSARAYLMPDCDDTQKAWEMITSLLPAEKVLAKTAV